MADVHRKIELQEQDDLRYLINNARHRASEKIDEALPPIQGEDALRRRVEELVHEVSSHFFFQISLSSTPVLHFEG
jgi:kinetochor protein Mis14/NSL1